METNNNNINNNKNNSNNSDNNNDFDDNVNVQRCASTVSLIEPNIIKQGWLYKQGGSKGGRLNWKKRWFVIKEDTFYYYNDESLDGLLGLIPLKGCILFDYSDLQESEPPELDIKSNVCYECKNPIGTFSKARKNCRHCGKAFCKDDTKKKTPIPKYGFNIPVRVCDVCYEVVQQSLEGSKMTKKIDLSGRRRSEDMTSSSTQFWKQTTSIITRRRSFTRSKKFTLPTEQKPHLFALKNSERELWVHAETKDERLEWIKVLKTMIKPYNSKNNSQELKVDESNESLIIKDNNKQIDETNQALQKCIIDRSAITRSAKVASGAFGDIYKARLWETDIAVKTVNTDDDRKKDEIMADVLQEISILSNLRHPNIVLYLGASLEGEVEIYTEWCEKGSLYSVIHDFETYSLNAQLVLQIATGIAQGMNYLHSLSPKIIHRDLKSHNILIDKNLIPKVADFGLSTVREKRKEEVGSFGTPEWMAPEMMEGSKYTEKIDVYSFGILLCELVSRVMPFHDQYEISSYMDVCDAVLDDGAIPTIPKWCNSLLKPLILQCLNRNPKQRPSFTEIIESLRRLSATDDSVFFFQYDIPRIRDLMLSVHPVIQASAAREICTLIANDKVQRSAIFDDFSEFSDWSKNTLPRRRGRHRPQKSMPVELSNALTKMAQNKNNKKDRKRHQSFSSTKQYWHLDDDDAAAFLERFTALLSSSSNDVLYHGCEAISEILRIGDRSKRTMDRRLLVGNGIMSHISHLLENNSNSKVIKAANKLLIVLTNDLALGDDRIFDGLSTVALRLMEGVISNSLRDLQNHLSEAQKLAARKQDTIAALQKYQLSVKLKKVQSLSAPRLNKPKSSRRRSTSKKKFESPIKNDLSSTKIKISNIQDNNNATNNDNKVPSNNKVNDNNDVANKLTKGKQTLTKELQNALQNMIEQSKDYDVPVLPLPDVRLPYSFREHFPFARHWGSGMRWNDDDNEWCNCFIVLCYSEAYIFDSKDDYPDDPLSIIRTRTPRGDPSRVKCSIIHGRPFVLSLDDCGYEFHFYLGPKHIVQEWIEVIVNGDECDPSKFTSRLKAMEPQLSMIPNTFELSEEFEDYYPVIEHANYILVKDEDTWSWRLYFAVLLTNEIRLFENENSQPDDNLLTIYCASASEDTTINVKQNEKKSNCFTIDKHEFACANEKECNHWLRRLNKDYDPVNSPLKSASSPLLAPNDNEARKSVFAKMLGKSSKSVAITRDESWEIPFNKTLGTTASWSSYLYRKRRFSGRYTPVFCILMESRILLFKTHESQPKEPLYIIYTCTASGRAFDCKLEEEKSSSKYKHSFTIKNPPNQYWTFYGQNSDDIEHWLTAIRKSVRVAPDRVEMFVNETKKLKRNQNEHLNNNNTSDNP